MRIDPNELLDWTTRVLNNAEVREEDSRLIARCLVDVDLRGIFSHGTQLLCRYVGEFRSGLINTHPHVKILEASQCAVRLDGDGGAGYLAATRAIDTACNKAIENGIAMATTCNHGHVGSAGIYARMAIDKGLVSWCLAGGTDWRKPKVKDATVWDAITGPPACFGIPSSFGPPLIVDMNTNLFLDDVHASSALRDYPKAIFASLGLKYVSTLLGGMLAGTVDQAERKFAGATRGFLFVAIDPAKIGCADSFKCEVARIIAQSRELKPIPGVESADPPAVGSGNASGSGPCPAFPSRGNTWRCSRRSREIRAWNFPLFMTFWSSVAGFRRIQQRRPQDAGRPCPHRLRLRQDRSDPGSRALH